MSARRKSSGKLAAALAERDARDYPPPPEQEWPRLVPDPEPGLSSRYDPARDFAEEPLTEAERERQAAREREARMLARIAELEAEIDRDERIIAAERRREQAPQPARFVEVEPSAPFTPTHWRSELFPNLHIWLDGPGLFAEFKGGSYFARTQAEEDALAALKARGKPIRRWSGVAIHRCGLCDFASTDLEEVEEHRARGHSASAIMEG